MLAKSHQVSPVFVVREPPRSPLSEKNSPRDRDFLYGRASSGKMHPYRDPPPGREYPFPGFVVLLGVCGGLLLAILVLVAIAWWCSP